MKGAFIANFRVKMINYLTFKKQEMDSMFVKASLLFKNKIF